MKISNLDSMTIKQRQRMPGSLSLLTITVIIAPILLIISLLELTNANRVSDKIYSVVQSNHFCSRRLNATHQMGCQSELGGNLGIVWIVERDEDLEHILIKGPTPPYIAVLPKSQFSRDTILNFKAMPGRVSGVVFMDKEYNTSESRSAPFSPDDICPNRYSGLYANDTKFGNCKHPWQEKSPISGLLYDDIPFPIFLINEQKSIDIIESCFRDNNVITSHSDNTIDRLKRTQSSYPLCGIQLDSFMMAAKDTHFCLNSHFLIDEILQSNSRRCLQVDNQNVFAYYKPAIGPLHPTNQTGTSRPDTLAPNSVVILMAKLSSISMFSEISPGVFSTLTSIITLLAVAEALGRVKNSTDVVNSKRNIAFAVIDSEPFDYTGSSKMIHNMMLDSFPNGYYQTNESEAMKNLNLSSIDYIINLDQVASYPSSNSIYFHSDPRESSNDKLDKVYNIMQKIASQDKVKLEREQSGLPLPPSSVQEFIKQDRANNNKPKLAKDSLTGVVLSNYGKTYKNLVYHSIYDNSHNIPTGDLSKHLAQVSKMVARTLYEITFEVEKSDAITVDEKLIHQLIKCYLFNADCSLFTRACRAGQKMPEGPIPTYKDATKRSDDMNGAITANLLAYFLGNKRKELNLTECHRMEYNSTTYNYQYINDQDEPIKDVESGVCLESQVLMPLSYSPAYVITSDEITIDPKYPAWTVSLNSIRNPVRLYLVPSPVSQWCLFLLGIVVTIASFVLVHYIRENLIYVESNLEVQAATPT